MVTENQPKYEFAIVVPCFNEEAAISSTVHQLCEGLGEGPAYQVIVVNDGSSDESEQILLAAQDKYEKLTVISHDENRGYGAALKSGLQQADARYIAITDADGTYPNDRLMELVKEMQDADMVVGARTGADVTYSSLRAFPKWFMRKWVSWISRVKVPDINSGLRVFRKDLAVSFIRMLPNTFSFTTTITLLMLTNYYRVKFIPISYSPRVGKSKIRPIRDTIRFLMLIARTGTYFAPVRVLLPLSGVLALGALFSIGNDVYNSDLTNKSVLLVLFSMNTAMFALLADMVDKRFHW
ncbi:MAG: glycosyltransferase [Pseudomonadales bacterium]|nr:glycosyltransferase [Pseudomonadales bacterium]